jgi:tetratricopeptide (TPR) repeat protein
MDAITAYRPGKLIMRKGPPTMPKKQPDSGSLPAPTSPAVASRRIPLRQALGLPVLAILLFFVLLEGGLALFGLQPTLRNEDPFVGFAANVPLFTASTGVNGKQQLTTAANKKDYFNRQSFSKEKEPNTYRIFSLGGSTTYGHPYSDSTSFSGWLRQLLPVADSSKNWEVINAGGISYASYRVAQLMEELVQYQPDLFIIFTGHNEFLEERTYRKLKEMPPLIRATASLLAKTRTWTALTSVLQKVNLAPVAENETRYKLGTEVDAILDRTTGPKSYARNDTLKNNILNHYRISLEQMVTLAQTVGAQVIFVTPAANLKDCSPFKSEHTPGISEAAQRRAEDLLTMSTPLVWEKNWPMVLNFLDEAAALDPRFAELQYRRGQALLALGRDKEAKTALRLARDEDVCPLRALTPMTRIVTEVARQRGAMLVDFVALLEERMVSAKEYPILGAEFFLDHVHPTIEGHKLLAVALLETMSARGLVRPGANWGAAAIAAVTDKIAVGVDQGVQGQALANLARVLLWAGKEQDATRLAKQALALAGDNQPVAINATTTLATIYIKQNNPERAVQLLYAALKKAPGAIELRLKLGQIMLGQKPPNLEGAAANLLLITQLMPYYDQGHTMFGIAMADRGRPQIAYASLMQALRMNPNNKDAGFKLAQIRPQLAGQALNPQLPLIQLERYPSSAPRRLSQGRLNAGGRFIPDGIEAEFHENGRLKRFIDFARGKANGLEMTWDTDGKLLSRRVHK